MQTNKRNFFSTTIGTHGATLVAADAFIQVTLEKKWRDDRNDVVQIMIKIKFGDVVRRGHSFQTTTEESEHILGATIVFYISSLKTTTKTNGTTTTTATRVTDRRTKRNAHEHTRTHPNTFIEFHWFYW